MEQFVLTDHPHRRYNPLLDEWILVSPQRAKRPWQGQNEAISDEKKPEYDETCYLCPGNHRITGGTNPNYESCYVFDNDFPALLKDEVSSDLEQEDLFKINPERGINRVICFSPKHNVTLAEMQVPEIENVVRVWKEQYLELGAISYINHVQIFENKGSVMGCSNPHPHGQIWAQSSLPTQVKRTQDNLLKYFQKTGKSLLKDYLESELQKKERIIAENEHFVLLVPFWATWPYETMIISKRHFSSIAEITEEEIKSYAEMIQIITVKYDNLFKTSFPYSAGIHQAPTDGLDHEEWHFHMHFYPPLLRSATVKKFMVGYELLAEAQRDLTAEQSSEILRNLSIQYYKN
ncbi:UDP-glucose--hexose-1-phosphate uridylyltransferase [Cloacibacterium caeni]|uniref:UDP-glucose--hexose-1-phosphate uridylyltransferase n=1 Tax=Cloacibacterium caeni TaxID=2004710 RepID=UPI001BCB0F2D|nr:UDP-glucose--hexose-1-phosphate uridylyltransferase [Cloacibacterium caeni]